MRNLSCNITPSKSVGQVQHERTASVHNCDQLDTNSVPLAQRSDTSPNTSLALQKDSCSRSLEEKRALWKLLAGVIRLAAFLIPEEEWKEVFAFKSKDWRNSLNFIEKVYLCWYDSKDEVKYIQQTAEVSSVANQLERDCKTLLLSAVNKQDLMLRNWHLLNRK